MAPNLNNSPQPPMVRPSRQMAPVLQLLPPRTATVGPAKDHTSSKAKGSVPWLKFAAIAAGKGISMAVACPSICVYPPPNAVQPSGSVRSVLAPCWLCPGRPRGHPAPFYFPPIPNFPLLPSPGGSQSVDVFWLRFQLGGNMTLHGLLLRNY